MNDPTVEMLQSFIEDLGKEIDRIEEEIVSNRRDTANAAFRNFKESHLQSLHSNYRNRITIARYIIDDLQWPKPGDADDASSHGRG